MNAVTDLDHLKLAAYLEQHVAGFNNLNQIEKFSVGQSNPTFLLHADSGKYVLRRQPPGELLKSAHMVDREFRVMHALENTDVPVPTMYHLCEDKDILGSLFFIMSFVDGEMLADPALPKVSKDRRASYHHKVIETLAAIHNVDLDEVDLADYGKGGQFFERQIGLWTHQYRSAETELLDDMETLINWLPANLPQDDGQVTLIHGDYKFDNMLFVKGQAKVAAVLDWELSTLGHPIADLAYLCMGFRIPSIGLMTGLGGLDRDELAIPEESELVAYYCQMRQIEKIEHWNFYLAFSFFRLASICQGVYKRSLGGNASSEHAADAGKAAKILAKLGVELI